PGRVERWVTPRLRSASDTRSEPKGTHSFAKGYVPFESGWLDLMDEHDGAWQNHAFCDAVLIAEAGRRPKAHLREVSAAESLHVLRRIWPMVELHPARRQSQIAARLAQTCRCAELQLSRNPKDLLALLNTLRYSTSEERQPVAA